MTPTPEQARALIGSVLHQRYVVVEAVGTGACGVRFVAYDLLNLSHIEILVKPDESGGFSAAGYVKAGPPLGEDRSPERGLHWSKPPPTKTPEPAVKPAKKCGGLPIKPPPVYFPPKDIDPLSTVQLDESDLIAVGLLADGSLSIPSAAANIMTWSRIAAAEREEIEQDLRYLTRRRRMLLAALLGFAVTSVVFLVFMFSGDPEPPSPPVVSKQPRTASAPAPASEKAAKPRPAPAPEDAAAEPKQAKPAPAAQRPKARPQRAKRARRGPRAKRPRRAKRHTSRVRRRRYASRAVDADALLAVGRSHPRTTGTVDPFVR